MPGPKNVFYLVPSDLLHYCPNCGHPLTPKKDYASCRNCQTDYQILGKLDHPAAQNCANCGNPLEGEGNKSRLYNRPICDACKDFER